MRFVLALPLCLAAFAAPPDRPAASTQAMKLLAQAPIQFEAVKNKAEWIGHGPGFEYRVEDRAILIRIGDRFARVEFDDARPGARFEASEPATSRMQYFLGKSRTERQGYLRLRQKEMYRGIDVVYYGKGQDLEYDFEVAPGADPSKIRLRFPGSDAVELQDSGELVLTLGTSKLGQRPPVVYQRRGEHELVAIESRYVLEADGTVRLKLGEYDRSEKLIVDPVISFTAYLAGSASESATACVVDAQGFVYIGGNTNSTNLPLGGNGNNFQSTQQGNQDAFVIKLNPNAASSDQVIVYGTYVGGGADDTLRGLAVDAKGLIYVTGTTLSGGFPLTSGALQASATADKHVFVTVIDPSKDPASALVYSTYLGGTKFEEAFGIAVFDGKVFVAGYTTSDDFPIGGASQLTRAGGYDAFITELDPTQSSFASLLGSTYFGGTGMDIARGITVDAAGFAYVTGVTYSADLPTTDNAYQRFYQGAGDAWVAKFDVKGGVRLYSSYLGTRDTEEAKRVVVEPSGRVAVAGYTNSSIFPVTSNAAQTVFGGETDAFLSILDLSKSGSDQLVYSTYYGGSGAEVAYDLKRDAAGKYYLGGYTLSRDLPVTFDAPNPGSNLGGVDGFVAVINPSASLGKGLFFSTYITSGGNQVVYALDVDARFNLYVTGFATANVFPSGSAQHTSGFGNTDVFFEVLSFPAPGQGPEPSGS
jgi:hypothetical protein